MTLGMLLKEAMGFMRHGAIRLLALPMVMAATGEVRGESGFYWDLAGNDASGLFILSAQEFENKTRAVFSAAGGGAYVPAQYDAGILGFAKQNDHLTRVGADIAFAANLVIPERIKSGSHSHLAGTIAPVTYIESNAFYGYTELLSVTIPSSVQCFGISIFAGCTSLQSVKLKCKTIAMYMFEKCTSLRHIEIPDRVVTNICSYAFKASGLQDVLIPGSVPNVGAGAFINCASLATIVVSNGVRSLGPQSFMGCSSLRSVKLPSSIYMGREAFKNCTSLPEITLRGGVTISSYAFHNCTGLKCVVVEDSDSRTTIDQYAFAYCKNLERIVFNGDSPYLPGINHFVGVPSTCTVYVPRGSTGWGVDIPGKWHGLNIAYIGSSTHKVTFDANGGSVSTKTRTVASGAVVGTLPSATRKGYTLTGWYTKKSGGTKVGASTIVKGDVTYYAQWKQNDGSGGGSEPITTICWVTFDYNGGGRGSTYTVKFGNAIGTLPKATRKGYRFKGWYTKKSGGVKIKTSTRVKKSVTYYARWVANKYKIRFYKNGGRGSMKAQSATYGKNVTLRSNAFKRSMYKFAGWARKKSGRPAFKNKAKVKNLTAKNGDVVKLYAVWTK